jgi:hypothetical protein
MISAQTRLVFVAMKNRHPPIGAVPEVTLFRIMLCQPVKLLGIVQVERLAIGIADA